MELSDLDVTLLALIAEDGARSYRELARRAGSTAPTVKAHLERLRGLGLYASIRADIDASRFGRLVLLSGPASAAAALADDARVFQLYRTLENRTVGLALLADDDELTSFQREHADVETRVLTERTRSTAPPLAGRTVAVACSQCGKTIEGRGIELTLGGRPYVACCPTCRGELERRYDRHAGSGDGN